MLRSWLNRLRGVVGDRRVKPRFSPRPGAPLVASIALLAADAGTIMSHVRDLSESGLSFFVLDSLAAQRDLLKRGAGCRVVLALPAGVIYLFAELVWCKFLDEHEPRRGGVLAVRITEISPEAGEQYLAYIKALEGAR